MPRGKAPAKKRPAAKKTPAKKKAAARGRGRKSSTAITVDFTDVDTGGGMPTPDGIYVAEVRSAEKDVSSNGNDMVVVRYKTNIGSVVYDRFMIMPQSLWVLRTALDCMGFETEDGEFTFEPEDLVGQTLGIEITNEEYEEKDQPRVTGYLPVEAAEAQAEGAPAPDSDDDEDEEEDDQEEEDQEEEEEDDEPPPSRKKGTSRKKKEAALRAGNKVTFEDGDDEFHGVIEYVDENGMATVVDEEDDEWEIPVSELTKA